MLCKKLKIHTSYNILELKRWPHYSESRLYWANISSTEEKKTITTVSRMNHL